MTDIDVSTTITETELTSEQSEVTQQQISSEYVIMTLARKLKGGADWFYWIAGLSVVNSLLQRFGGGMSFVSGLVFTQFVDALAKLFAVELPELAVIFFGVGIAINLAAVAIFGLFGFFARRKVTWIFIVGMVLYLLDSLLSVWVKDYYTLIFHGLGLYGLYNGLRASMALRKLDVALETQAI